MIDYLKTKRGICIRLGIFLTILALLFSVGRIHTHLTEGFSIANITTDFPYREEWEEPPLPPREQWDSIRQILKQRYVYLGKGAQTYAFLSEDGQYVMKFVKQKHLKIPRWQDIFLQIPFLEEYRQEKLRHRKEKVELFINSSRLSYEELADETAVLYVHLKRTENLGQITIINKMGIPYTISLDDQEFVLQKKAIMLESYLVGFIEKGDFDGARNALQQVIDLLVRLSKKEIVDKDWRVFENIGFVDNQAIYIDIGQFVKDPAISQQQAYKREIVERTEILMDWLKEKYPDLALTFEQQLQMI